jgi:hypothetical protein
MKKILFLIIILPFLGCGGENVFKIKDASILFSENEAKQTIRAINDLCVDIQSVTGTKPEFNPDSNLPQILIGTFGKSALIDDCIDKGIVKKSDLEGKWESFVISVTNEKNPRLVIAGSDFRGTIYGIYTLAEKIGVSPWYWWADVPVRKNPEVSLDCGFYYASGEPTVKYRGFFINDEDWGLKPWAAENFEKDLGDIGPKTYAKVCELLLRLKANMLAPAMHSCTGAFYSHKESKTVADSFGIIITTSHCEPLLLNNAAKSEWNQTGDGDWNFKTNRETILKKWDSRLAEAAEYENIYTVAMRGLHDEGLRGELPMNERVPLISEVISEQRKLLEKHTGKNASDIPQIFVPYKETMDIYENGLKVPDDITLVWVDDNYGYMKRVSNPEEQKRGGRAGVYYHLSYLGTPHDYLWVNTTPPVLMYNELKKAYDNGADRYWLLNVGDIKPMELGIQTFMDMAWNFNAFNIENVNLHQAELLSRLFGQADYQSLLDGYYRLAWSRKPEYMGFEYEWDTPEHTGLRPTEFSSENYGELQQRLADYKKIFDMADILSDGSAAWFEMVEFPVKAAYQMNRKFLMAQLNGEYAAKKLPEYANWAARQSKAAFDEINALNEKYNSILNGKWRGMMSTPPGFCALYQNMPEVKTFENAGEKDPDLSPGNTASEGCFALDLSKFSKKSTEAELIAGLGYDWKVMKIGEVEYEFETQGVDSVEVLFYSVPFWPLYAGKSNGIEVSVDSSLAKVFVNEFYEWGPSWKEQVLRNGKAFSAKFAVNSQEKKHTVKFRAVDDSQMIQKVIINLGGLRKSYLGPESKN